MSEPVHSATDTFDAALEARRLERIKWESLGPKEQLELVVRTWPGVMMYLGDEQERILASADGQ